MVHKLLQYIPPHRYYVEMFGGGAALLFAKEPCAGIETYNDLNGGLVNLFTVLRDDFERFHRLVSLTLYSREEFQRCCNLEPKDNLEWAYAFFVNYRMSIAGIGHSTSWSRQITNQSCHGGSARYTNAIERLPQIHDRLAKVQIERRDFRELFPVFVAPETLIYCDPPYLRDTRASANMYVYEMSNEDHKDLLNLLLKYPQMALLSGYDSDLYNDTLQDWHRIVLSTTDYKITVDANRPKPNEILWLNPLAWDTLHQSQQLNLF